MRRVERREHFKIERSSGFSSRAIQMANSRGRWLPQIQILWSVAWTEESCYQATVLGNQQWRLHCLQNEVWGPPQHRDGMFRSAPMWNVVTRLKRACAGVETARRPCRYSEHRPNVGRLSILRKSHVTQERWVRSNLWEQRCGDVRIHSHHILFTNACRQRVSRSTILLPKDGSNPKLPYKGSSRGGTIELFKLWHDNKLEIPIPDWSWKGV